MEEQRDEKLWRIAKRRASFRQHLYSYVFVNFILWVIWWVTSGRHGGYNRWPWPMWVTVFWGIAILSDYFSAYHTSDKESLAEEEYKKLKRREGQ